MLLVVESLSLFRIFYHALTVDDLQKQIVVRLEEVDYSQSRQIKMVRVFLNEGSHRMSPSFRSETRGRLTDSGVVCAILQHHHRELPYHSDPDAGQRERWRLIPSKLSQCLQIAPE